MILGNIPLSHRNKIDAKILLGYLPSLEYSSMHEKRSTEFHLASLKVFHFALATILRPLRYFSKSGIHLYVNNNLEWFYPFLALVIADWPEGCAMCGIYGSPTASFLLGRALCN